MLGVSKGWSGVKKEGGKGEGVDYMVGEIGVHDDDKVACCELEAVHICSSEAELACARLEDDAVGAVDGD